MTTASTENNDALLELDATPDKGTLGTRRVNNMPLIIIGSVVVGFLIIMMLVMIDRSAKQHSTGQSEAQTTDNNSTSKAAAAIVAKGGSGIIPEPQMAHTPAPEPADELKQGDLLDNPFAQSARQPPKGNPQAANASFFNPYPSQAPLLDEEAQRIRELKMQQFHQAVHAKTTVSTQASSNGGGGFSSNGSSLSVAGSNASSQEEVLAKIAAVRSQLERQRQNDPTAAYQQRLAALKASGLMADMGAGGGMDTPAFLPSSNTMGNDHHEGNDYSAFDKTGQGDRWQSNERTQAPRSAFELRAGFVLPATMISGINSDLPGQLMAQVSQNVYDTATGRHLLVPQGTRLVGSYSSDVIYGQSRILIAWQRLIFPDGKALDLGSMPGADSAGFSGLSDQVNNHYVRLFANAFLMSGITAAVSLSQDKGGNQTGTNQRASDALSESLGQGLEKLKYQPNTGSAPGLPF